MKKYIILTDLDGESAKYKYSLWEVFEYEDGTISQNSRCVYNDNLVLFLEEVRKFLEKTK